jgi:DNA-binding PadR family transcriptional regulator
MFNHHPGHGRPDRFGGGFGAAFRHFAGFGPHGRGAGEGRDRGPDPRGFDGCRDAGDDRFGFDDPRDGRFDPRHAGRGPGFGHGPRGCRGRDDDRFGFDDPRDARSDPRHAGPGRGPGFGHGPGPGDFGHGPHGAHGRGGGRGGRGGLGRFFAHGDLRLVVLNLIAEKPRHGYEIIKAIEDRVAGAYSPSPGVIYPTLTLLEDIGYVTVTTGDGGKKLHEITDLGRAFLEANRPILEALEARMAAAGERGPGGGPAVAAALERLRRAVRTRLARPDLDPDRLAAVVAALEAAAAALEDEA